MFKKLAKIKYLPNNFEIIEEDGDHVICAISGKKFLWMNLNYWNVDFRKLIIHILRSFKKKRNKKINIFISNDYETKSIDLDFLKSFFQAYCI